MLFSFVILFLNSNKFALSAEPATVENTTILHSPVTTSLTQTQCEKDFYKAQLEQAKQYFSALRRSKGRSTSESHFFTQTGRARYRSTALCTHSQSESESVEFLDVLLSGKGIPENDAKACYFNKGKCAPISCIIERSVSRVKPELNKNEAQEYALRVWNFYENFDSVIPLSQSILPSLAEFRLFQSKPYPTIQLSPKLRPIQVVLKNEIIEPRALKILESHGRKIGGISYYTEKRIELTRDLSSFLHEYGHFVSKSFKELHQSKEFKELLKNHPESFWRQKIGLYGSSNAEEFFAESFAAHNYSANAIQYSVPELNDYFKKLTRKVNYSEPKETKIKLSENAIATLMRAQLDSILRYKKEDPTALALFQNTSGRIDFSYSLPKKQGSGTTSFTAIYGLPFLATHLISRTDKKNPISNFNKNVLLPAVLPQIKNRCVFGKNEEEQNQVVLQNLANTIFPYWTALGNSIQNCIEKNTNAFSNKADNKLEACVITNTQKLLKNSNISFKIDQYPDLLRALREVLALSNNTSKS